MTNSASRLLDGATFASNRWMLGDIAVIPVSVFAAISAAVYFTIVVDPISFYKRRRRWLLMGASGKGKRGSLKKNSKINIGAIFGMDVGGTLTKIVFFQATSNQANQTSDETSPIDSSVPRRKSSENLAQLEQPDHQEALQNFYAVMDPEKGALGQSAGVIRDSPLNVYSNFLKGTFHFLHFETRNMMNAIHYVSKATAVSEHIKTMGCTGGGAHKYDAEISEELDIEVHKYDELGCLVRGMLFALNNFPNELYTYRFVENHNGNVDGNNNVGSSSTLSPNKDISSKDDDTSKIDSKSVQMSSTTTPVKDNLPPTLGSTVGSTDSPDKQTKEQQNASRWQKDTKASKVYLPYPSNKSTFPYLIVNIGSGVSILKVTGPGEFQRVSGSSLGGGTYWGLCRLLIKADKYEEVLQLAEAGDAGHVDMLVKDIYGGDYGRQLSGTMVASSFGKLVMKESPREGVKEEDIALALLMMITNNIGQVAYLNAQLHNCQRIFFVGSFLRNNQISCRRLAFAIDFWTKGKMEALFLTHEGYLGALGTFLHSAFGEDVDQMLHETERERRVISNNRPFGNTANSSNMNGTNADVVGGESGDISPGSSVASNGDISPLGMEGNDRQSIDGPGLGTIRRLSHNFREWSKSFALTTSSSTSSSGRRLKSSSATTTWTSSAPSTSMKQRNISAKKNYSSDNLSEISTEDQESLQQIQEKEIANPTTPNTRRRNRSSSDDYVYRSFK